MCVYVIYLCIQAPAGAALRGLPNQLKRVGKQNFNNVMPFGPVKLGSVTAHIATKTVRGQTLGCRERRSCSKAPRMNSSREVGYKYAALFQSTINDLV